MLLTPHFSLEEFTLSSTALALGIDNKPTPREWRTADGTRRVLLVSPRVVGAQLALILRDPGDMDDTTERLIRNAASFRAVTKATAFSFRMHFLPQK